MSGPRPITLWRRPGARVATRVLGGGDVLPRMPSVAGTGDAWAAVGRGLAPLLDRVDATVVNLECPLTDLAVAGPKTSGTRLRADPGAVALLAALKVRVAGLANNHSHDQGRAGVRATERLLGSHGIAAPGASSRRGAPPPVCVFPLGDRARVGVYAASMDLPERAGWRRPGIETFGVRRARRAAERMGTAGATVRIALLHLGSEGADHPHPADVARMDRIADRYHLVAACHSHRIGGHRAGPDALPAAVRLFGLGSVASTALYGPPEREGIAALVELDDGGAPARSAAVPLRLVGEGRPTLPDRGDAAAITARFRRLSDELADGGHVSAYRRAADRDAWRRQLADARRLLREQGPSGLARKVRRARARHVGQFWRSVRPGRG